MNVSSLAGAPKTNRQVVHLQQTRFFFPMIFLLGEEAIPKRAGYTDSWPTTGAIHANTTITAIYTPDSSIVIPPQPTSPGELMPGGEGEPVENLNGYLLPYDSPYLKANIEYLGNLYWDNNTEEYWLSMTKCSLISLFLSSKIPAAGILGAAATFLDVFNHFFG